MMQSKPKDVLSEYMLFTDGKFLSEPLYTQKLNEFDSKMLKLKQQILGLKNINILDDELFNILSIQLSESFIYSIQQWQIESIIDKTYLLLKTQEQGTPNVLNMDNSAIVYLINRNIKFAIIYLITKIVMKRINSVTLSEQLLKFFETVIDLMYDLLIQDEIALQCYGYACFKMYEKLLSDDEQSEEPQIFESNHSFHILQKIKQISKHLLNIFLSNFNQATSEIFLEKYEILMLKCLKSTNYFSQQGGLILLSNILKVTETCYHTAMYSILQEMNISQNLQLQIYRVFALLSPDEQLVKNIFTKIGSLSLSNKIHFLSNFLHDGLFQEVYYSFDFKQQKFDCFTQEYSQLLLKCLYKFYQEHLKQYVDEVQQQQNKLITQDQNYQIESQKVIQSLLRNAELFNLNTFQLYSDLKQYIDVLQKMLPNNSVSPYIINNMITIIIQYNQALFQFQEIAPFFAYLKNQSFQNTIIKAKIYFLLSYSDADETNSEVQKIKQVSLKQKFGKLIKQIKNVKLEYFALHCAELYLNNSQLTDIETDFDEEILNKILSFVKREEKFQADRTLYLDSTLQNTKTNQSFNNMVENLSRSASILFYISKIKNLVPTIPQTEKESISYKLSEIIESINF
ncbi:hypothetical protein ABPG74_007248 [Tetrahymena malaccensis]